MRNICLIIYKCRYRFEVCARTLDILLETIIAPEESWYFQGAYERIDVEKKKKEKKTRDENRRVTEASIYTDAICWRVTTQLFRCIDASRLGSSRLIIINETTYAVGWIYFRGSFIADNWFHL